jgi:DNA (cytosine-5)-methyltransferase 1
MKPPAKILDGFAGIGGFSYAAHKIVGGFETTQFIEIDKFCQKLLAKRFPNIPIHDDVRTFTANPGDFDVFCSGFPCQDISVAGLQKGITKETRSGLFFEVIRIIRMVRPKFVVLENVAAILNNGLDIVLGELSEAGYDAEWAIVSCEDMGGCHRRQRWWCVAYPNSKGMEGRVMEVMHELQIPSHSRKADSYSGKESTDTDNNGSSSTEKCRINEETGNGTSQGQKAVSQSQRSSEPTGSGSFQSVSNTSNPYGSRTQGNWSKEYKSIWTNAFINSSQRRTLGRDWTRYVSEPCLRRGDDGLRGRMDRLKSLGNSVSPPVAAIPLQRVHDLYYK